MITRRLTCAAEAGANALSSRALPSNAAVNVRISHFIDMRIVLPSYSDQTLLRTKFFSFFASVLGLTALFGSTATPVYPEPRRGRSLNDGRLYSRFCFEEM